MDDRSQIYYSTDFIIFCCIQDDDPNYSYLPFDPYDRTVYSDIIDDDPMFVREPNDGGDGWGVGNNDDFGDLHLQFGSPCINAGHPFFSPEPNSVDIDGDTRIFDGCVDIGADEFVAPVVVTKPKGGEVWAAGSTREIKWYSNYVSGTVDIRLSINGGGSWTFIESGITNTGSYKWLLPEMVDSNKCLVSIIPSAADPNVFRLEGNLFTIKHFADGPAVESKWESLGRNFKRTGLSDNIGPELGCVKWKFETDGAISASVTVGFDGRVHIPCEDGKLYTLDANGILLWSYDANSSLLSSPTIGSDGTVYAGSESGILYAVDVNGILRWTYTTSGPIYSSPAVSDDGEIYVCSQDGTLHALGPDGSELWSHETGGPAELRGSIFASPAIGLDGTIYIAGLYDPNLYAFEPNNGSVKWRCSFEFPADPCDPNSEMKSGWPFASPVVAADGTIYQTLLYDSNLYAIEPNNGTIIWSVDLADPCTGWFDLYYFNLYQGERPPPYYQCIETDSRSNRRCYNISDSIWSEPVLGPDGTIYVSFDDPYLRSVDPNGSIKWIAPFGSVGGFTLAVDGNGLIYTASDDANLYVVDSNGTGLSEFQTVYWLSFPVIAADNMIIVGGINDDAEVRGYPSSTIWAIKGYGCEDLNLDETVNFFDFALLAADWLDCTDPGFPCNYNESNESQLYLISDIDQNKYVHFTDLSALAGKWLEYIKWLMPPSPTPSPGHAINPIPLDGATDVGWTGLSWKAGLHATSHDVYFGTSNPPPFVCNQTATIFYPSTITRGITYYWRIDEVNMWDTTIGVVWSFTTSSGPFPPPPM
jgi:outer membrane protein assembly factor BamB